MANWSASWQWDSVLSATELEQVQLSLSLIKMNFIHDHVICFRDLITTTTASACINIDQKGDRRARGKIRTFNVPSASHTPGICLCTVAEESVKNVIFTFFQLGTCTWELRSF